MAYNPISGFTLQVITSTGQVASDYYLKFYEANTTTPLSMATDSTGANLLTKAKIGDKGMPVSNPLDNSTVFIPHVNASYRLVIYTSEADADANNTAEAYVNVPFISTLLGSDSIGTGDGEIPTADLIGDVEVTATGATTPRSLANIVADTVNIKGFESLVTSGDWKPAFDAAALLGHPVFIPNGEYLVSGLVPTNWELVGESEKGVAIKLMDGINNNAISLINNTSLTLKNLTIDQNKTNQTGGHCIRFGGADGVDIQNVTLKNAYSYGIGVQAGTNKNIRIHNLTTLNTGQDGIDIKDYNLDNENIVLSNITCINYGLNATGQTGVDIRGPIMLSNLKCSTTASDTRAFRLRGVTAQGRAGSGVINNIHYTGAGDSASYAVQISTGVTDYTITNVYCENTGLTAVFESGTAGKVNNIVGKDISGDALSIKGDGVIIDGFNVDSCLRGFDIESSSPNNSIINFDIRGVTSGEFGRVQSGSTGFKLLNGKVEVGKALNFAEAPVVRDVANYKTRATVVSSDILVDSLGTKGFLIPHGLDITPDVESVQLTLIRSTNNPVDEEIGYLQVEAVDSTNISGRLFVTLASGVVGAAVKVSARVVMFDS